jgi:hypothetical protein
MAFRASPPRKVAAWTKTAVEAAEAVPSTRAAFVNLEQSTMTHADGFAQGVYAILPDKHHYDRLRFLFGPVTLGNADNTATVAVYEMLADDSVVLVGESALTAAKSFLPVTIENRQGMYAVIVKAVAGTTQAVTFNVFIQGVMQGYVE